MISRGAVPLVSACETLFVKLGCRDQASCCIKVSLLELFDKVPGIMVEFPRSMALGISTCLLWIWSQRQLRNSWPL